MADFDLTQTDQQVQNILNDAQGAMGASAQTTLTTEYVMLKDTSGVYHKILKSSFTEAIRDVLAGLLVNNDKGTTINQIAAIASGDFGSITPANLASVLGGIMYYKKLSFDQPTTAGQIIDTGIRTRGLLIVSANGTSSVAGYIASGNELRPLAGFEPVNISTAPTAALWQIYDDNGALKAKNIAARSSYNFILHVVQISPEDL